MTVHNRNELTWKKNKLYYQNVVMASVYPDKRYPEMYHIHWFDKSEEPDFYNLTRTKNHAVNVILSELNRIGVDDVKT